MTSFGTPDELIDFQINHPDLYDNIITGGHFAKNPLAGSGFEHLYVKSPAGVWIFTGGGSSGGSKPAGKSPPSKSHPGFDNASGNGPPNIADTNGEQKLKDIYAAIEKAKEEKQAPTYKGEEAFDKFVKMLKEESTIEIISQALEHALALSSFGLNFLSSLFSPAELSNLANSTLLISTEAILTNASGKPIGKFRITKDAKGKISYTVYSTNPNTKGSYFQTTQDGSKFPTMLNELQKHAESDTTTDVKEGKDPPAKGETVKEDAKDTDDEVDVEDADPPDDVDQEDDDDDEPVVVPLG